MHSRVDHETHAKKSAQSCECAGCKLSARLGRKASFIHEAPRVESHRSRFRIVRPGEQVDHIMAETVGAESGSAPLRDEAGTPAPESASQGWTRSKGLTAAAMVAGAAIFGVCDSWINFRSFGVPLKQPANIEKSVAESTPKRDQQPLFSKTTAPGSSLDESRQKSLPKPLPNPKAVRAQQIDSSSRSAPASDSVRASESTAAPTPTTITTKDVTPARPPFFAPNEVTAWPRIVSRVEPQVPREWRHRAINDVVVLRLLVSQSGHPSRVSVLRHAKSGPLADEAAIAAVNQWTFLPAQKKGEPVSCWFNLGVPISNSSGRPTSSAQR
jgi:TonB family protein